MYIKKNTIQASALFIGVFISKIDLDEAAIWLMVAWTAWIIILPTAIEVSEIVLEIKDEDDDKLKKIGNKF